MVELTAAGIDASWILMPAIFCALAGLLVLGIYLFSTFWKTSALTTIRQVQQQIRRLRENKQQFTTLLGKNYSPEDPEPYGSRVVEIHRQLDEFELEVRALHILYAGAQQVVARAASRRWQSILLLPYNWYRAQRVSVELKTRAEKTDLAMENIENFFHDLEKLGWEVANLARDAVSKLQEVGFLVEQLTQQNIHGSVFDGVIARHADLRVDFQVIPDYFFTSLEADFLTTVRKSDVIQIYQLLHEKQFELDGLLRQVRTWIDQSAKASDNLLVLLKSVERIRGTLSHAPEELNFSELKQRANQLAALVNEVDTRLAVPVADELPGIARETSQMVRLIRDMDQQFQVAVDHLTGFKKMLADQTSVVSLLAARYVKYEKMPFYPVVWDINRPRLGEIRRQIQALGGQMEPRSPAQMKVAHQSALALSQKLEDLQESSQEIEKHHDDLVVIMQKLKIPAGLDWCRAARLVLEQAQEYHPDNWSRKDDLDLLPDIERIEETFLYKLPQNPLIPLKESELGQILAEVFQVSDLYEVLQNQVKELQKHLADLQSQERGARENLSTVLEVVNQVGFITEHNRGMETIVTSETEGLQRNVDQLMTDLGKRNQGSVEKKVKKVKSFIDGFERMSSGWMRQLLVDSEALQDDIAATLRDLSAAYPHLEDPAILEAQASLAGTQAPVSQEALTEAQRKNIRPGDETGGRNVMPRKNSHLSAAEASAGFRLVDGAWQKAASARENIRQVAVPVLEAFYTMEEQRREIKLQLDRLAVWIGEGSGRGLGQQHARLAQEYDVLEKERESGKENITAIGPAVQNLERFNERGKVLADRIRGVAEQVETEQRRIEQLQFEIDLSIDLWQQQRRYPGIPETQHQIQTLINEVERNLYHLKEQYQVSGISYPQFIQELISLSKRLNNATIPVDGDQRIDIHGSILPA